MRDRSEGTLKRTGLLICVAMLVMALAAGIAGCGGGADPLETYKGEMQAWVDKYQADLTESSAALDTITDPMNATDEQIQGVKAFSELMNQAITGLDGIKAPDDLAAAHKDYVDGIKTMSSGFAIFVEAMDSGDATKFQEAMTALASGPDIEKAETTLEEALGFKLSND